MAALAHLVLSWLAAAAIVNRLFPQLPAAARLAGAFCVSIVLTAWVTFGAAMLAHAAGAADPTLFGVLFALVLNAVLVVVLRSELAAASFRMPVRVLAGTLAGLAASGWIVAQRLGGDPLQVSLNTWGDTALHIGIARSFSHGANYPPQLPIYSGDGIRYHFGVDFYAGTLEKLGMPIDWAFNIPATLGFTAILVLLGALAWHLWRSAAIGVIAGILFLTNGSLAFLRYFAQFPTLAQALAPASWWHLDKYLAIAPYQNDEVISIFWTLNPYLTQTHLIVGVAIILFVTYVMVWHLHGDERPALTRTRAIALGLTAGLSFWINGILVITAVVPFCLLIYLFGGRVRATARPAIVVVVVTVGLFALGSAIDSDTLRILALAGSMGGLVLLGDVRRWWPFLVALGVTALPQLVWLNGGLSTASSLEFHWGYLVPDFVLDSPASWLDFLSYWWLNLGLVGPLVILAAVVARRADRKLLVAIMGMFVFGNIVSFGEDVGGHGHKVFNLWETQVNLFAAFGLVWLAQTLWRRAALRPVAAVVLPVASIVLVLSGLLDVMTLKNDPRYDVFGDNAPAVRWITENTPTDAVFFTSFGDPYAVPTLAGRRVYVGGFTGWVEGFGYPDAAAREATVQAVYSAPDRTAACGLLRGTGATYIQVGAGEMAADRFPHRNATLFPGDFVQTWSGGGTSYYDVRASCGNGPSTTAGSPQ